MVGGLGPFWPISKWPRLKTAQTHEIAISGRRGSDRTKGVPEKVEEDHPGGRGNLSPDSGTPVALGPETGPEGLVAACLLARRASSTLVP